MVTIKDVAKLAQVSTSTVSHVINDTRFVSDEKRNRVLSAIEELNYQHNSLARSLRNRTTHTIGVLVPNSANPYFAEVLAGIESACYDNDYHLIMGNAHDDPERELSYIDVLLSRQVDGVLLISTGAHASSVERYKEAKMPVVMVDRSAKLPGVDEIFTDNRMGGSLAAEYLIRLNHQHLACVAGPSFLTPSAERVAGFRAVLEQNQFPNSDEYFISGDFQYQSGYKAAQKLLNLSPAPTAIFACNDLMAVGVIAGIMDLGLRVPEDVSVIGYDDIPLASYINPRLTTISQPAHYLGALAVERLLQRIEEPDAPEKHEMLSVTLVERKSCAYYGENT